MIYGYKPNLTEIKASKIAEVKQKAYDLLKETDWMIIKWTEEKREYGEAEQAILDARAAIRTRSNQLEDMINAATLKSINEIEITF